MAAARSLPKLLLLAAVPMCCFADVNSALNAYMNCLEISRPSGDVTTRSEAEQVIATCATEKQRYIDEFDFDPAQQATVLNQVQRTEAEYLNQLSHAEGG